MTSSARSGSPRFASLIGVSLNRFTIRHFKHPSKAIPGEIAVTPDWMTVHRDPRVPGEPGLRIVARPKTQVENDVATIGKHGSKNERPHQTRVHTIEPHGPASRRTFRGQRQPIHRVPGHTSATLPQISDQFPDRHGPHPLGARDQRQNSREQREVNQVQTTQTHAINLRTRLSLHTILLRSSRDDNHRNCGDVSRPASVRPRRWVTGKPGT
jgi:hypothetical protein